MDKLPNEIFEIIILVSFDVTFVTKSWVSPEILIMACLILHVSCIVFEILFAVL